MVSRAGQLLYSLPVHKLGKSWTKRHTGRHATGHYHCSGGVSAERGERCTFCCCDLVCAGSDGPKPLPSLLIAFACFALARTQRKGLRCCRTLQVFRDRALRLRCSSRVATHKACTTSWLSDGCRVRTRTLMIHSCDHALWCRTNVCLCT